MTALADVQAQFRSAILEGDTEGALAAIRPGGVPVAERLAVHRNNTSVLTGAALVDTFPVVQQLVGHAFFAVMAQDFLTQRPPVSGALLFYGREFPGFVAGFEPARTVPYIADVARLEWAIHQAYHSADAAAADMIELFDLPPESLVEASCTLCPSLRLVQSPWAVDEIWEAHSGDVPVGEIRIGDGPVYLTVARDGQKISVGRLRAHMWRALSSLKGGMPLGEVLAEATAGDSNFDASELLSWLLTSGRVTGWTINEEDGTHG